MNIPNWLQCQLANAFPSLFLQPDEPPTIKDWAEASNRHAATVVHHNHITINFTGLSDDFPAFREQLLKTFEDIANRPSSGDAS